jgi:hypothetical protein
LGGIEQFAGKVRDVLVYYEENDPRRVEIFVVLRDKADREEILDWLTDKVAELLDKHIVVSARYAEDSSRTPFSVIETYYGLYSDELSLTAS